MGGLGIRQKLERCRTLELEVHILQEEMLRYKDRMKNLKERYREGMPTEYTQQALDEALMRLERLSTRLQARLRYQEKELEGLAAMLDPLPPVQRQIMELRYIQGKSWDELADLVHFSLRHCFRIHNQAVARLEALESR